MWRLIGVRRRNQSSTPTIREYSWRSVQKLRRG
ncbi:hypothetical protein ANCCAN_28062 [Ancylostoma caninum]|uniref:Uncharacterized protein n=1 Tax=Ancylostoma caninum TaxID=29170 RepID=A0A368F3L3_ANCCA|nr:hypothetical protein ANCCAN_28062 [Ancylostoma caninum]